MLDSLKVLVLVTLCGAFACGGAASMGLAEHDAGPDDATADAASNPPAIAAAPGVWTWVDVSDSSCDDGSPTGFAVNPNDGSELFIYFEGGGACWDYNTCFVLNTAVHGPIGAAQWTGKASGLSGLFARGSTTNPFRTATMIYIPYCTGDVHAGDNVPNYPDPAGGAARDYHHVGRANVVAFLSRIVATWPSPARVVVSGSSAGGFGATFNYNLFRDAFPQAHAYLIADAGPLFEGDAIPAAQRAAWYGSWAIGKVLDPLCADCGQDLSALYPILLARHPDDRMALLSSAQDMNIRARFMLTAGQFENALLALIQDRFAPSTKFRSFVIPGAQHTLLGTPTVATSGGVVLESWLSDMVNEVTSWQSVGP